MMITALLSDKKKPIQEACSIIRLSAITMKMAGWKRSGLFCTDLTRRRSGNTCLFTSMSISNITPCIT